MPLLGIVCFAAGALGALPDNDNFAVRVPLAGSSVTTTGSNVGATREIGEPDPNFTGGRSVWWTWTSPANGYVTITTAGSSFDTMLTVFTGNVVTNLTLVAFNDNADSTGIVSFNVTAGTAYQIAVDGADNELSPVNNAQGNISLQLSLGPTQTPPANDNFANRITISGSSINNITGSNLGATKEAGEPFHADAIGEKSIWWTWTAPASGGLTLNSHGSAIDTLMAVYTGNSVGNLTLVAANDEDPDFGSESTVTCNVVGGVTYQIVVDGFEGDAGDTKFSLDLGAAFPVPANDNFANRIPLTGSSITTNVSNIGATYEAGEPAHLAIFGGKTVWFRWTAPAAGGVTLTVSNNALDTLVAVYTGTSLGNLNFVAGNDEDYFLSEFLDGDSTAYFNAVSGTTYVIAVDGVDGNWGAFQLRLTLGTADSVPANNNFANSVLISGTNTTVSGSNLGATLEPGEPLHRGYYGGSSVWWRWVSPGPGMVTIDTSNNIVDTPDTLLAVYTGSSVSTLTEVASDNNSGGANWTSLVSFPTKGNETYRIAVDGYDGDSWSNIKVRVRFGLASYSLTVVTNPAAAGTVTIDPPPDQGGKYAPGSIVTLTASPGPGNTFTGWSGDVNATNNPLVISMNANKTIEADYFVPPTTKIWTGGSPAGGNWTDSQNWGGVAVNAGDNLVFPSGASQRTSNTNNFPANTIFNSLTIGGDDYILRGNALALTGGITATNSTGTNTINLAIQLNSSLGFHSTIPGATLVVSGNVSLGMRTLTADAAGDMILSGVISGSGALVKTNTGTLRLEGNNPNTYSGVTTVSQGTLELGKAGIAVPGDLTIGDGNGGVNADTVRYFTANQIGSAAAVTVTSSGRLDLNGFNGVIGSLTIAGGNADTGSGTLGLNGNVTANASSQQANITGKLSLQGATRTFTVGNGAAAIDLLISAAITNGTSTAGITKTGAGTLQLAGANNYSGLTTVSAGAVSVTHASGLGTTGQGTTVSSGALLVLSGALVNGETLALTTATLQSTGGSNAWTGNISLTNTCSFAVGIGDTLNLPGILSGPGAVTKTGDGTLVFSGPSANTYGGATTVNQGTLALGKAGAIAAPGPLTIGDGTGGADADVLRLDAAQQIPTGASITVNSSGLLNLNNRSASLASLTGSGHVDFGGASAVLSVGANGSTTFNGLLSGAGQLIKTGNGTLTLTANNTYTGQTTISNGTLIVNGTQSSSAVLVTSAGTLGGTGRVGNLSGPGTVSPGASPGTLLSGTVTFTSNTVFRVELDGTTVGSGYDQLNVSGTVNLAGTLNATLGFTPAVNDTFTIIDNNATDVIVGTFNGLPQGSQFSIGGVAFQISYTAGAGANNVTLTRLAGGPPIISSITIQTNAARIQGSGQPGLAYVLENAPSIDLPITWTEVSTNVAGTNGTFQFIHADALSLPVRLYRVRAP